MKKDWLVLAFAVAVLSFRPCCSDGRLRSEVEVCITRKESGDVFALALASGTSAAQPEDSLPCWLAGALCSKRQVDRQDQDNVTLPPPCIACECPASAPHFNALRASAALCESGESVLANYRRKLNLFTCRSTTIKRFLPNQIQSWIPF